MIPNIASVDRNSPERFGLRSALRMTGKPDCKSAGKRLRIDYSGLNVAKTWRAEVQRHFVITNKFTLILMLTPAREELTKCSGWKWVRMITSPNHSGFANLSHG